MSNRTARFLLAGIVVLQLTLSLVRIFQVPMWTSYIHEIDTYRVIRFISENGRFPTESDYPPGEFEIRQGSQPPLYALMALPFVAAFDDEMSLDLPQNPAAFCIASDTPPVIAHAMDTHYNAPYGGTVTAAYALRVLSALLVAGAVIVTYFAGTAFFPQRPAIGLVAAGILAFESYHVWLGTTIINDNLLLIIASANLFFAGRVFHKRGFGGDEGASYVDVGMLVLTAVLAVLAKLSGWVLLGLSVLLLGYKVLRLLSGRQITRRQVQIAVGVLVAPILMAGALAIYNQVTIGSPFGRYSNLIQVARIILRGIRYLPRTILPTLSQTWQDYPSVLWSADFPARMIDLYQLATAAVLVAMLVGIGAALWRRQWRDVFVVLWLLLVVFAGSFLVILRNHIAQGSEAFYPNLIYAPMRYYVTMTPALMLAVSFGLSALMPQRWTFNRWNPVGLVTVMGWLAVMVIVVVRYPMSRMISEQVMTEAQFITGADTDVIHTGDQIPYVHGYAMQAQDGEVEVEVFAGTDEPLTENFVGQIELVDANGTETLCQFLPVRGLYPSTRWQPDDVVHQVQRVRNCSQPLAAPVEVRFSWQSASSSTAPATLTVFEEDIGISSACPPNYGVINGEIQIVDMRLPDTADIGDTFQPYLNYILLDVPFDVESRTFEITHQETGETYTCKDLENIHGREITFQQARGNMARGQTVFLNSCPLFVPDDATAGVYDVVAFFTDEDGERLPINDANGNAIPNEQVTLGAVALK